jgi:hypothetical protein
METVAVLDFETTGLSPNYGDKATEIAITLVRDGQVVDRYQSLMNAGRRIPAEVTQITGITNAMIATAPPVAKVMREACNFVGKTPVVAHNASFDKKFWDAERAYLSLSSASVFACTMLLSRRIYPNSQPQTVNAGATAWVAANWASAQSNGGCRDDQSPVVSYPARCRKDVPDSVGQSRFTYASSKGDPRQIARIFERLHYYILMTRGSSVSVVSQIDGPDRSRFTRGMQ